MTAPNPIPDTRRHPGPNPGPPPPHPSRRAFTLIEFVAVLSILSIAAAVTASSLVGRLKRATRESDTASVAAITDALRTRILRTQHIPAAADLPAAIAQELGHPISRIHSSLAGIPRVFLTDPSLEIGSPTSIVRSLPFTQSVRGSVPPANPRVLVISSLASPIPVTSPPSTTTFSNLWENISGTIPADWSGWIGETADLRFGRLDLRALFHRVVFNNVDQVNPATYSIGVTTNSLTLAVGQRLETWFLADTAINLHFADSSLQAREFLRADTSYVFENGRWSRDITYGVQSPLGAFGQLVADFLASPVPPGTHFGSNPQAVVEEFFTYLYSYGVWASGSPPDFAPFETGGSNSDQQVPYFRSLKDCQARLDSIAGNLIK